MKEYIPYIAYALWCIFFAFLNYIEIVKLDEKILHWFNGLMHLTCALFFGLAVHWWMGLSMPLIGRLFFDVPLNLFRKLPFDYVPERPKSLLDKAEIFIFFGNGWLPKIIYTLALIALNV